MALRGIPGGVEGVESYEQLKGYESVFAGDSAIRNVRFRLQVVAGAVG